MGPVKCIPAESADLQQMEVPTMLSHTRPCRLDASGCKKFSYQKTWQPTSCNSSNFHILPNFICCNSWTTFIVSCLNSWVFQAEQKGDVTTYIPQNLRVRRWFCGSVKSDSPGDNSVVGRRNHPKILEWFWVVLPIHLQKISKIFPKSTDGWLVVWVGGLDSRDPLMKGIVTFGYP